MFRYRRYRVFVILAAIAVFLLYQYNSPSKWQSSNLQFSSSIPPVDHFAASPNDATTKSQTVPNPPAIGSPSQDKDKLPPPEAPPAPKPNQNIPGEDGKTKTSDAKSDEAKTNEGQSKDASDSEAQKHPMNAGLGDRPEAQEVIIAEKGKGRWSQDHLPSDVVREMWTPREDHFPVPIESIIPLPTGVGKKIPKIQTTFKSESSSAKQSRQERLEVVKESFTHAWKGYKTYAWGKDELSPVSGKSRNTFNGWRATLVDTLDTLWIMGMKEDFEEALEQLKSISFHTSERADVPLFETTIRYLGGLLGAYDVSEAKYPILLEKATQLGDMLMGAFDTPNRFPLTYFHWKKAFTSQPHRAPSRVVLAEIGSLQMEFTRLSQLTGNSTYYDAIARIIDALKDWQEKTLLPGMWPADIDTSGCNTSQPTYQPPSRTLEDSMIYVDPSDEKSKGKLADLGKLELSPSKGDGEKRPVVEATVKQISPNEESTAKDDGHDSRSLKRRNLLQKRDEPNSPDSPATIPELNPAITFRESPSFNYVDRSANGIKKLMDCTTKGLDSAPGGTDKYTLGSTADSAYEYLSKMYLLLNGQVEDYRTMYERSIDVANRELVFRIMIPDEKRELYASGELFITDASAYSARYNSMRSDIPLQRFNPENSHLTCFVGGMFAMGSKIFDRPEDLKIAAKLTDGCVWAYESTKTGIMPEMLHLVPCKDRTSCPWNETAWHEAIDPDLAMRQDHYKHQMELYGEQQKDIKQEEAKKLEQQKKQGEEQRQKAEASRAEVTSAQDDARAPPAGFDPHNHGSPKKPMMAKRQVDSSNLGTPNIAKEEVSLGGMDPESKVVAPTATEDADSEKWRPSLPLSREEVAGGKIKEHNLKEGMKDISDPRYILRPEALESVFYMHRITGDPYWREAGWKMTSSILKATRTTFGHASVDNVNNLQSKHADEMESFWLAETLKYAYLLFDDEERYSLDDWVFTTEAHLFKRPTKA